MVNDSIYDGYGFTVFMIIGLTKGDWIEALLFGISIAVGLTPEMLR